MGILSLIAPDVGDDEMLQRACAFATAGALFTSHQFV
jgi:hypothetical protein